MRTGLLAKKIGMTTLFADNGDTIPVTILSLEGCAVVRTKTKEKDGYDAVQVGCGSVKPKRLTQPMKTYFEKYGVTPKAKLVEFRCDDVANAPVGTELSVRHFIVGQNVDVVGLTKGKGFAGSMKRHNFHGLRASHGVSVSHRSHGSTGNRQDPGKVFKNKKMAGHLGCERVTTQNLKIAALDEALGLIMVKGAVPGHEGSFVMVRDAVKKSRPADLPQWGIVTTRQSVPSEKTPEDTDNAQPNNVQPGEHA